MEYHNQPKSGFDNGSLVYQYFCGNKDICLYNKWKTVCLCGNLSAIAYSKVQTLWEGHKIWKNLPLVLTKPLFLLSSVKTSGRFFQIFVAISEKLCKTVIMIAYFCVDRPRECRKMCRKCVQVQQKILVFLSIIL